MDHPKFKILRGKGHMQKLNPHDPYADTHDEGVDPDFLESVRCSLKNFSFVSESESGLPVPTNKVHEALTDFYVMSRVQWIQCLKVLFDQLLQVTSQQLVETQNFLAALRQTKDLMPLRSKAEYMSSSSEVSFSLKEVESSIQTMSLYITWDNIIDIFLNKSIQPPITMGSTSGQAVAPGQKQSIQRPSEKFQEYVLSFADSVIKPTIPAAPMMQQQNNRYEDEDEVECEIDDDDDSSTIPTMLPQNTVVSSTQNSGAYQIVKDRLNIFSGEEGNVSESQATGTFRNTKTGQKASSPHFHDSPDRNYHPAFEFNEESKSTKNSQAQSSSHQSARYQHQALSNSSGHQNSDSLAMRSDTSSSNTTGWVDKDLSHNGLKSLEIDFSHEKDKRLLRINVSNNQISKIRPIIDRNIQVINLANNRLSSLSGLSTCPNLKFLNVSQNQIKSLSAVNSLIKLQELYVASNLLSQIKELHGLKNLRVLDLSYNRIIDSAKIIFLGENKTIEVVSFIGNPCTKTHEYHNLANMEFDHFQHIDPMNTKIYSNMIMHESMCFTEDTTTHSQTNMSQRRTSALLDQNLSARAEIEQKKKSPTRVLGSNERTRNAYQLYKASTIQKPLAKGKTKDSSFSGLKQRPIAGPPRPQTSTSFRNDSKSKPQKKSFLEGSAQKDLSQNGRITPRTVQQKFINPKAQGANSARKPITLRKTPERSVSPTSAYMKRSTIQAKIPAQNTTKATAGKKFDFSKVENQQPSKKMVNLVPKAYDMQRLPSSRVQLLPSQAQQPPLKKDKSDSVSPIRDENVKTVRIGIKKPSNNHP